MVQHPVVWQPEYLKFAYTLMLKPYEITFTCMSD
jgi:hypothetical protein